MPKKKEPRDEPMINTVTGLLECYTCGATAEFRSLLPQPVDVLCAITSGFAKVHKKCKKTEAGAALKAAAMRKYDEWAAANPEEAKREEAGYVKYKPGAEDV